MLDDISNILDSKNESKDKKLTRKERDFLHRREDFLQALDRLSRHPEFKNFSKINLNQIAHEAGYSKPTLYSYFESKEDLLYGFAAYSYRTLRNLISDYIHQTDQHKTNSNLYTLTRKYYQFIQEHPAYISILNYFGKKGAYIHLKQQVETNIKLSFSKKEYLHEKENFRHLIGDSITTLSIADLLKNFPKFSKLDIAEVISIIINGVITEFNNKSRVLQEKGISEEEILEIIMELVSRGIDSYS